jgi:hypothetical protein
VTPGASSPTTRAPTARSPVVHRAGDAPRRRRRRRGAEPHRHHRHPPRRGRHPLGGEQARPLVDETSPIFLMIDASGAVVHASPQTRPCSASRRGRCARAARATSCTRATGRRCTRPMQAPWPRRGGVGSSRCGPGPGRGRGCASASSSRTSSPTPRVGAVVITGEDVSEAGGCS